LAIVFFLRKQIFFGLAQLALETLFLLRFPLSLSLRIRASCCMFLLRVRLPHCRALRDDEQRIAKISIKNISLAVLVSTIYYTVVYYHIGVLSGHAPLCYVWLYQLTGPFYCLILIFFYLKLSTGWTELRGFLFRYLERIGEDSFGIYLVQGFFITVFWAALFKLGLRTNNLILYPVLFSLTLVPSYLSVEGLYRLPLSNIIIGKPRKEDSKPTQTARISSAP
jgi:peptidoglycan/LPS O-acetylase OafA/YrhL